MTCLSLFSGIGGIDLAAQWAGFEPIQFVEKEPYCQRVLARHWPGVPIHDDVTTFDGTGLRGRVDLVAGGPPCQPVSVAGRRRRRAGQEPQNGYAPLQSRDWREWGIEPVVRRGDDGLSSGLDSVNRIKALGNAVVPQQAYPVLKAIADAIRSEA